MSGDPTNTRTTLITGAGGGIGAACAVALACETSTLILCDRAMAAIGDLPGRLPGRVITECGDITKADFVHKLVSRTIEHGSPLTFVAAAGLSPAGNSAEDIYAVNLLANHQLIGELTASILPGSVAVLLGSQAGTIAGPTVTEEVGRLLDNPGGHDWLQSIAATAGPSAVEPIGAYRLSKNGVQRLAAKSGVSWARRRSRVVSVSPGIIETEMSRRELAANPEVADMVAAGPTGGRMGTPDEVASVIAFVSSPAASFVNAIDILVDGGSLAAVSLLAADR